MIGIGEEKRCQEGQGYRVPEVAEMKSRRPRRSLLVEENWGSGLRTVISEWSRVEPAVGLHGSFGSLPL